jgi:hypothetical protein
MALPLSALLAPLFSLNETWRSASWTQYLLGPKKRGSWPAVRWARKVAPPTGWRSLLPRDHYIRLDSNDYSVHPTMIGRRVEVTADLDWCGCSVTGKLWPTMNASGCGIRRSAQLAPLAAAGLFIGSPIAESSVSNLLSSRIRHD